MPEPIELNNAKNKATEPAPKEKIDRIADDAAKKASETEKKYDDKQNIFTK